MNDTPLTEERKLLAESLLGTVETIAWSLAERLGEDWLSELQACGNLAAVEAAQAYDFTSETPVEGFAWRRIAGAMIDRLRQERRRLSPALAKALEKTAAAIETAFDYAAELREAGADDVEDEADGTATGFALAVLCMGTTDRNPEAALLRQERRLFVERAVAHLPDRERRIVSLHYFEGQKLRQIAASEGVEPRTIFTRHRAALKRLAATLRPMFFTG